MPASALRVLDSSGRPVRKAVQRLRWFIGSLKEQVQKTSDETGVRFAIDEQRAIASFMEWVRAFEAQKPEADADRRAYVGFAAGLMLRALMRHAPVTVLEKPGTADGTNPAFFWPDGYAYVAYCLNVRSAVLEQDFREDQRIAPELAELRTWWSFRENVAEDPSLSIAFLDLFAGEEPDWTMPDIFRSPDVRALANRFYAPTSLDRLD